MSSRPYLAITIALLLGIVATVATSQTPGNDRPPENGEDDQMSRAGQIAHQAVSPGMRGFGMWPSGPVGAANQVGAAGNMIGFSHADPTGTQTITLVDTGKSWIAVYHIDRSGKLRLVSSRPIDADFSLQLNVTAPLPEEIRRIGKR